MPRQHLKQTQDIDGSFFYEFGNNGLGCGEIFSLDSMLPQPVATVPTMGEWGLIILSLLLLNLSVLFIIRRGRQKKIAIA